MNLNSRVLNRPVLIGRVLATTALAATALIGTAHGQVVTTEPDPPTVNQPVTIFFDATEGNRELEDYDGDVYAHTGVVTDQSQTPEQWLYVIAEWAENLDKARMTRLNANLYSLQIDDIRDYYGVPADEEILRLAFVFRSSDGQLVGRDTGAQDIFVDLETDEDTDDPDDPDDPDVPPDSLINVARGGPPETNPLAIPVEITGFQAAPYRSDLTAWTGGWQAPQSIYDQGEYINHPDYWSNIEGSSSTGSTWNNTNPGESYGILIVDLQEKRTLSDISVFQMFSDGKTTHIALAGHPETGSTAPEAFDDDGDDWEVFLEKSKIGPGTNHSSHVSNPAKFSVDAETRYVKIMAYNDGSLGHATYIELKGIKMYGEQDDWPRDTDTEVVDVTNPETGRIWMDRNLGASRAATSSTDEEAYGDLYQWGRAADGHQQRNSPTTSTLSDSDQPGHGSFILATNEPYDWRIPQNEDLWQGLDGVNNPCPAGYRLPTEAEWSAERNSWSSSNASGALNSPLKLPLAGGRGGGMLFNVGSYGFYWSSTVSGSYARFLNFGSGIAGMYGYNRADGASVRCIKDTEDDPDALPELTTTAVSAITRESAISGGDITDEGGSAVTARGVVWSTGENPTLETNDGMTLDGTGTGTYESRLTGLAPGTEYFVRAYATNVEGTAYGLQKRFRTHQPGSGVTDIDGNEYRTIIIGNQEWMAENLRSTRYRDGTEIPTGLSDSEWASTTSGAMGVYPHGSINGLDSEQEVLDAYGRLYNWHAAVDPHGLCPEGWQVPTADDWDDLIDYVTSQGYSQTVDARNGAGDALKSRRQTNSPFGEPYSTLEHPRWDDWEQEFIYGQDVFGFYGLPGGFRGSDGNYLMFYNMTRIPSVGRTGIWWSSTENDTGGVFGMGLSFRRGMIGPFVGVTDHNNPAANGFSIRCIVEPEPHPVSTLFEHVYLTATRPEWFADDSERGMAAYSSSLYVVSRSDYLDVRVLDATTGEQNGTGVGTLNTTGVHDSPSGSSDGFLPLNDITVTDDGVVLAANLVINQGNLFRVYRLDADNPENPAQTVVEWPLPDNREVGHRLVATGSLADGTARIYAPVGEIDSDPQKATLLVWSYSLDDQAFTGPDIIELDAGIETGSVKQPAVAPVPYGRFFWTAHGQRLQLYSNDGTLLGQALPGVVPVETTALRYLGTLGDSDNNPGDHLLAAFVTGKDDENSEEVILMRITDLDNLAGSVTVIYRSPDLHFEYNPGAFGDVTSLPLADGTANLYLLATNNGIAGYQLGYEINPPDFSDDHGPFIIRAPDLAGPDDDEEDISFRPRFEWDPVANALAYHLQISERQDFSGTHAIDVSGLTQTFYQPEEPLKGDTRYYWRVRGLGTGDRPGSWSAASSFTVRPQIVVTDLYDQLLPFDEAVTFLSDITIHFNRFIEPGSVAQAITIRDSDVNTYAFEIQSENLIISGPDTLHQYVLRPEMLRGADHITVVIASDRLRTDSVIFDLSKNDTTFTFRTRVLGDFTGDGRAGAADLIELADRYHSIYDDGRTASEAILDIGPATGTAPLMTPQPDGAIDFEDFIVFALNWQHSLSKGADPMLLASLHEQENYSELTERLQAIAPLSPLSPPNSEDAPGSQSPASLSSDSTSREMIAWVVRDLGTDVQGIMKSINPAGSYTDREKILANREKNHEDHENHSNHRDYHEIHRYNREINHEVSIRGIDGIKAGARDEAFVHLSVSRPKPVYRNHTGSASSDEPRDREVALVVSGYQPASVFEIMLVATDGQPIRDLKPHPVFERHQGQTFLLAREDAAGTGFIITAANLGNAGAASAGTNNTDAQETGADSAAGSNAGSAILSTSRSLMLQEGDTLATFTLPDQGRDRPEISVSWAVYQAAGYGRAGQFTKRLDLSEAVPQQFELLHNYPNPFNPATTIRYHLPEEAQVRIRVYDVLGRLVTTLVDTRHEPGYYQSVWDGTRYASGVYLYVIDARGDSGSQFRAVEKMMLIK